MKNFARFLSVMLSIALLLTSAPAALASTTEQREALATYLEAQMPNESVWEDTEGIIYYNLFDIAALNSDELEAVVVYANGSGIDSAIKKIVNGDSDAETGLILEVILNFVGKIAKNVKSNNSDEVKVYFVYKTTEAYAGGEYVFLVQIFVDLEGIYIVTDEIFGLTAGGLAFGDIFDPVTYELSLSE